MHSPDRKSSTIWGELLREVAQKEVRRITRSSTESQLQKIINRQLNEQKPVFSTPDRPLISWDSRNQAAFEAWMAAAPPAPVRWEEASGCRQWTAGDPIVLTTEGKTHLGWIKIRGCHVGPRWCGFDPETKRLDLDEVALRDPREAWSHSWLLQLANALLLADRHEPGYGWLRPNIDSDDPWDLEAGRLLCEAHQELR